MNRTFTPLLLALGLVWLAGCPASSSAPGAASFSVSQPQALSSTLARVSVTAAASDFPARTVDLVLTNGVWEGRLDELPAGINRAFVAQAFDSSGSVLFQGVAGGITLTAGKTALVAITLQQLQAPPVFGNEAPVIDSLVANTNTVPLGGELSLAATLHDPNPGDTLTSAWSSTAGSFSSASSLSTSWTAPDFFGLQTVTFTVTDSRGQASSRSLLINVTASAPRILSATRSSDTAAPGQELTFEVVASDPKGSALSFSWSATRGPLGTPVTSANTSRITWTAPACVPQGVPARVTVTVTNTLDLSATHDFDMTDVAVCPGWTSTGSLAAARFSHTATPLPSGKVLVAGGYSNWDPVATTEVYDPGKGTWSSAGYMSAPRTGHTATLLPDGRVLVAGGQTWGGPVSSAEVYDPGKGTWSSTGSMSSSHSGHTATLLPDGKVLVTGGNNASTSTPLAEVYDPASGKWSVTSPMASPRAYHAATLLPDGKVLVTGGNNASTATPLAEVYDPATGSWSVTGAMATSRQAHTATLLPGGKVLVAGGYDSAGSLATAEVYDPASNTWSTVPSMAQRRASPRAAPLPNGKVLISGGYDSTSGHATAEVYDPASNTWTATESMAARRAAHTATPLPNGRVLVVGGLDMSNNLYLATAELYAP